jgi:tRNA threonylcarbamoyladenosine biosynthesis protein TsaB
MKVLGIDTSTYCGSVGLVDEEEVISDYVLNIPVTHSERLIGAVDLVLRQTGLKLEDLDGWAIALGPGSFTGLRIGVSAVKGLALATGLPIAGIPTLDILACQISLTPFLICPILDARKGEVYTAFYRHQDKTYPTRLTAYRAVQLKELARTVEEKTLFIGDGVRPYGRSLQEALPAYAVFPPQPLSIPHGSMVARLGLESLRQGNQLDVSTFTPIYVRPSEAELKWREPR